MQIIGQLSEDSLPEVFQLIERVFKTGLLLLQHEINTALQPVKNHYLWFQEGRIVAMADDTDDNGLLSMLKQRSWLKPETLNLVSEWSEKEQSLGSYLKATGILTDEHQQVLFHAQTIQPVCALFKLQAGRFVFDTKTTLSKAEMTGLSLSASEASLLGLRVLRDWTALTAKLPHPSCVTSKIIAGKPHLQLDAQESLVWETADGRTSIEAIARRVQMPVETIQQIVFRMKMAGLVVAAAVSAIEPPQQSLEEVIPEAAEAASSSGANPSLMKNLVSLLNTKIV